MEPIYAFPVLFPVGVVNSKEVLYYRETGVASLFTREHTKWFTDQVQRQVHADLIHSLQVDCFDHPCLGISLAQASGMHR